MKRALSILAALTAFGLLGAQGATAAWRVGDSCVGDDEEAGWTAIVISNDSDYSTLAPLVPPEGARVITRWMVETGPGTVPTLQQLVATLPVAPDEDVLIGESALETVVAGHNEFATRVPVPEYAHVGLRGPLETLFCDKLETHGGGVLSGPWALGERRKFAYSGIGVPVIAVVEPDADGDGYGDETQDACPRSAALRTSCPPAALTKRRVTVRKRAILLEVQLNGPASTRVFGQVRWKVRRPGSADRVRKLTVGLSGGSARELAPDVSTTFRLPLRRPILRRLKRLQPSRSLRPVLTVRFTDLAGRTLDRRFPVVLPGRH